MSRIGFFDVIGEDGPLETQWRTYGDLVHACRIGAGMSLRDCAKAINRSAVYLGEIERGKRGAEPEDKAAIGKLFPAIPAVSP